MFSLWEKRPSLTFSFSLSQRAECGTSYTGVNIINSMVLTWWNWLYSSRYSKKPVTKTGLNVLKPHLDHSASLIARKEERKEGRLRRIVLDYVLITTDWQGQLGESSAEVPCEVPRLPGAGLISILVVLSHWLRAACGKCGLRANVGMDFRAQHLGPSVNYVPCCWRSERCVFMVTILLF